MTSPSLRGDGACGRFLSMSELMGRDVALLDGNAEALMVICAYCGRLRLPSGDWQPGAPGHSPPTLRSQDVVVSHGCCPSCFEREMAKCRLSAAAPGWRARRW